MILRIFLTFTVLCCLACLISKATDLFTYSAVCILAAFAGVGIGAIVDLVSGKQKRNEKQL